jgi:hypothetical protein
MGSSFQEAHGYRELELHELDHGAEEALRRPEAEMEH